MTCIVGIVEKGKIYIGADSASTANYQVIKRKDKKVFKNGQFIIGGTSSFRMLQLLRYSFTPPEINNKNLYEYMCIDFINALRKCFAAGGFLQKFQEGDEKGGTFLVGINNRLFQIQADFQVMESIDNYSCCGSGEKYALGSLHTTNKTGQSPKTRIKKALKAAAKYNAAVTKPFHIKTIKYYEKK